MRRLYPLLICGVLLVACDKRDDPAGKNRDAASTKAVVLSSGSFQQDVLQSPTPVLIDFWGKG